jgi:heme exporter protein D
MNKFTSFDWYVIGVTLVALVLILHETRHD